MHTSLSNASLFSSLPGPKPWSYNHLYNCRQHLTLYINSIINFHLPTQLTRYAYSMICSI